MCGGWASDGVAARGFVNGRGPALAGRDSTVGAYQAEAHPPHNGNVLHTQKKSIDHKTLVQHLVANKMILFSF